MGQVKNLLIEFEELQSFIDGLIGLFSDKSIDEMSDLKTIRDLFEIQEMIQRIDNKSLNNMVFVENLFSDNVKSIYYDVVKDLSNSEDVKSYQHIKPRIDALRHQIRRIRLTLENYIASNQSIYNSENYYNDQITNLERQRNELQSYLDQQKTIVGKSHEEIELRKREIREKEVALAKAKEQIVSYQKELEEKKKQENAIDEWETKIKSTFTKLTECLNPIKYEHSRLSVMFWIYSGLILLTIAALVFIEVIIIYKLKNTDGFPAFNQYIATVVPIPILGALLWVFVIQLNRTQRQLVILAKHIHEIGYVEGLLLSVNSLSPDISNSINRVNLAIDKLLDNHLNVSSTTGVINEDQIIFEEKKDKVPYELILKLLQDIKSVVVK